MINIEIFFWVSTYHFSFCRLGSRGGKGGGGETAAAALQGRRRLRATATTLRHVATARARATEVGFPPDFFPSMNRFLRFPSNLQNGCMKIVLGFFAIY